MVTNLTSNIAANAHSFTPLRTLSHQALLNTNSNNSGDLAELKSHQLVCKWNIKFSGDVSRQSVSAFLDEDLDERYAARNVTKKQLFKSAGELFERKAKIWFRSVRKAISIWQELVAKLKDEFQPHDYNDLLWEQIKCRKQGPKESTGIYMTVINNLFLRLTFDVPEASKV